MSELPKRYVNPRGSRQRIFRDIPIPREYSSQPLIEGEDLALAENILGIEVCLQDYVEDELQTPAARKQPLGRVIEAKARGDHVLIGVALYLDSLGVPEIVFAIEGGYMGFGLWADAMICPGGIKQVRPHSIRVGLRHVRGP
jgi:hypothetical protein